MKKEFDPERKNEAGLAFWRILLLIVLIGFIAAVVMKLMSLWVAVVAFIVAAIIIGLLANFSDVTRYMKISRM